ncbi:septum formation inhibitor Maf [Alkalilimnicola ehrlichii]|uniref:7-methyl-GTP pyrophosphatase n=1 Tax=Alkalilimnicola ehrlichii TaxID=351052 RepID=A0A3E0WPA6_9GAMM|nr:nucleoside triphosphate pyrophosphatase [Alkalilimnicola ehrlichii]RFA29965.1 septum formation inhibitor Maf [Alkalilimnicola ehrlichii]RFA33785.1 septum formation inhibitor Maf [Alkalilimnicola ehrlichii]
MLVLASSSPYRRALLDRLAVGYEVCSPDIDETRLDNEAPAEYVARLSREKAQAVASRYPQHLIIGSDQAATLDDEVLGKPGDHSRAREQLRKASGRKVVFFTGLSLLNSATGRIQTATERYAVHFRDLSDEQIERYLSNEQPYQCAGSFKAEGLGIALFERLEGNDPNSLIGLPLIQLVSMLAQEGVTIP